MYFDDSKYKRALQIVILNFNQSYNLGVNHLPERVRQAGLVSEMQSNRFKIYFIEDLNVIIRVEAEFCFCHRID